MSAVILGVLNVTPDSFSDGGKFADVDRAIEHGIELTRQGADMVDVGGESTRPGAERVDPAIERERVLPAIQGLVEHGVRVSVDTMNASTAIASAEAGVELINDVSGGLADPLMAGVVIDTGLKYVVMHWRGPSNTMQSRAQYAHTAHDVRRELFARAAELVVLGVDPAQLIIDPGLGFAKDAEQNWQLLAHLGDFMQLGAPVLIGASRKRFLADLLPTDEPVQRRDDPTAVISALAAQAGVWGVRVHNVTSTRIALNVVDAWQAGRDD